MIAVGGSSMAAQAEVYRDGEKVVVVTKGAVTRQTPNGSYRAVGQGMLICENAAVFEGIRNKAKRILAAKLMNAPALYAKIVRDFDLDKGIEDAEELPERLRRAVDQNDGPARLPSGSSGLSGAGDMGGGL